MKMYYHPAKQLLRKCIRLLKTKGSLIRLRKNARAKSKPWDKCFSIICFGVGQNNTWNLSNMITVIEIPYPTHLKRQNISNVNMKTIPVCVRCPQLFFQAKVMKRLSGFWLSGLLIFRIRDLPNCFLTLEILNRRG